MKTFILTILCLLSVSLSAQSTTITIRPDAAIGKDALIENRTGYTNTNSGATADFASWAWTISGNQTIARSLVQFDLSAIPYNAIITSATLSLFCNTTSSITQLQSGNNECYLQRITSNWNESTVTWTNQPTSTTLNQVSLARSTSNTQNYQNINVTQLVSDMKSNPASSFGFMLQLQAELTYSSMILASSDNSDSTKRPVITISYTLPCANSITIQPNAALGKDALIDNKTSNASINNGSTTDFAAWAWTSGGSTTARSLIQFYLSSIPANAVISSASLSLYCNTSSSITQLNSGFNESYLQRITSTWEENTVTWLNQPTTTTINQVSLNRSLSQTQDYISIDVAQLITDMRSNPSTSFGFMLRLQNEALYRSLILASSDHSDPTKRPKLYICYTPPNSFTLFKPNGGEKMIQNKPYLLTWNPVNTISNIGLQYTLNDGLSWNPIIGSTPCSTGSYLWNVPNTLSNNCRVRMFNVTDTSITDKSDTTFSIVSPPNIILSSPNGGELWLNNMPKNITWSAINSSNVKLEYTLNDSTWITIADNISSAAATYSWPLSGLNSNKLKVRVTDKDFPVYGDTSNAYFTVRNIPSITVTSPNGAETWYPNATKNITWTSSNSSHVNLAYSINDSIWIPIAGNISSDTGTYVWVVPNISSTTVKVRITDADFTSYQDKSNATFSILSPINVVYPNGGEKIIWGQAYTISWVALSMINKVNIQYSANNGLTWTTIASNLNAARGAYDWAGINTISNTALIRVRNENDTSINDVSDSTYSVINVTCSQSISIQPNALAGKDALVDSRAAVANTNYGTYRDFASWAWTNNGNTIARSFIQFDLSGLPANAIITDARLSLYCDTNSAITQLQAGFNESYLQRVTSNWNENTVTWNNQPIATSSNQVSLRRSTSQIQNYINADVKQLVKDMISNPSSSFGFMIKLQSEDVYKTMLFASSDHPDSTKHPKLVICYSVPSVLALLTPNGGEKLFRNAPYTITWNPISTGINLNLQFSSDNGANWNLIAMGIQASTGAYSWTVPNGISGACRIRIYNAADSSENDMSDTTFSIISAPSLQITSPNGAEVWINNTTKNITWTSGNSSHIRIDYSTNDSAWFSIATNIVSSAGTYSWILPSIHSKTVKVKITDETYPSFSDKSDSVFTIQPISSGIIESDLQESFIIYPNPTSGPFHIDTKDFNQAYTIRIYNVNGQLIAEDRINNQNNLTDYALNNKGIYIIELETQAKVYRKKIVVY